MPQSTNNHKPNVPCLLGILNHHLAHNRPALAVATLPFLFSRGLRPPIPTLSLLLRQCLPFLPLARQVLLFLHSTGLKPFIPSHPILANHILSLHFLCNQPFLARQLFDKMPNPNIFSYNSMLAGYSRLAMLKPLSELFAKIPNPDTISFNTMIIAHARNDHPRLAFHFYSQLRHSLYSFNPHTFSGLVMACVRLADLKLTRQVHGQVLIVGFLPKNLILASSLVDAYAKSGDVEGARRVFDEMPVKDVLAWTTLVYGYSKCGELGLARKLFEEMPERNPVSWTALIGGYARHGFSVEALDLFRRMASEGVRPDQFTFSSSLCACAAVASLKHGKQVHARLIRTRFHPNVIVLSSLIDMYSKCGDLKGAVRVFDRTDVGSRDVVLWNTMMSALGQHGHGREAIRLFEEMVVTGTKPDAKTFVVLLTACSHSGLVAEGVQFFQSMAETHAIVPDEEHLVCLVDLLGRAGRLKEAMGWIEKMPYRSSARTWNALLGACKVHENLQLGMKVAERVIELDPECSAAYVLLSNIYAELGRWDYVEKVRCLMEEKNMRKERSSSWIEVDNVVHPFGSSDQLPPIKEGIDDTLQFLGSQMEGDDSIT